MCKEQIETDELVAAMVKIADDLVGLNNIEAIELQSAFDATLAEKLPRNLLAPRCDSSCCTKVGNIGEYEGHRGPVPFCRRCGRTSAAALTEPPKGRSK